MAAVCLSYVWTALRSACSFLWITLENSVGHSTADFWKYIFTADRSLINMWEKPKWVLREQQPFVQQAKIFQDTFAHRCISNSGSSFLDHFQTCPLKASFFQGRLTNDFAFGSLARVSRPSDQVFGLSSFTSSKELHHLLYVEPYSFMVLQSLFGNCISFCTICISESAVDLLVPVYPGRPGWLVCSWRIGCVQLFGLLLFVKSWQANDANADGQRLEHSVKAKVWLQIVTADSNRRWSVGQGALNAGGPVRFAVKSHLFRCWIFLKVEL